MKITVFSIAFLLVFLQMFLAYPFGAYFGGNFYETVEAASGEARYMQIAYAATVLSFFGLILLYRVMPTAKYVRSFQSKPFLEHSRRHYVKVWRVLAILILFNCTFFLWQVGGVLPLRHAVNMVSATAYSIYRTETNDALNMSLVNITIYLLCTTSIFISFTCIRRQNLFYRVVSVALLVLVGCFSLARSVLPSALLILLFIYMTYKPFHLRKNLLRRISLAVLLLIMSFSLVIYSTQASTSAAFMILVVRIVYGQWLGLPLYFYYFKDYSITAMTLLHPLILSILGINIPSTPGRELMKYINPAGVVAGSAGNIPTFFVGEAYAVAGWWGVGLSVLYVALLLYLLAFVLNRMRKTYFSCCLYGFMAYKFSTGLVNGVSAFLFAGLPAMILCLLLWDFMRRAVSVKSCV